MSINSAEEALVALEQIQQFLKSTLIRTNSEKEINNTQEKIPSSIEVDSVIEIATRELQTQDTTLANNLFAIQTEIQEVKNVSEEHQKRINFSTDFYTLATLLKSGLWPEAVPRGLICQDSNEDKFDRAEGIIDNLGENFYDSTVLDFGCGEGHVAYKIKEMGAKKVVGYDIESTGDLMWNNSSGCFLTTDFESLKVFAPYQYVIVHDVLDHCQDPVATLKQIATLCSSTTLVLVRTHPFCARHATHLYRTINKAWIHMIFDEDELEHLGYKSIFTQKVFKPIASYHHWFHSCNFKILKEDILRTHIEPFFKNDTNISRRLTRFYNGEFPEWQMSQSFLDYKIKLEN